MARNCRMIAGLVLAMFLCAGMAGAQTMGCNLQTIKGTYGWVLNATIPGVGTMAGVGTTTFDGRGGWTGSGTMSFNGSIIEGTSSGAYSVNPDCTGSGTVVFEGGTSAFRIVIVDNGKKILELDTTPGSVATFIYERL